jgi:uncharacterized protein YraI
MRIPMRNREEKKMKKGMRSLWLLLLPLLLASLACGLTGGEEEAAEPEATPETIIVVATATPAPVVEPEPTEAPAAAEEPTLAPPPPAAGDPTVTSLVSLNVRRGPGTVYSIVGALPAGASAKIVGISPDGGWWKIECPPAAGGECWVSGGAAYSQATDAGGVPVAAAPPRPTHTPAAVAGGGTATYTPTATGTVDGSATPTHTPTATATTDGNATPTYTPTATATTAAGNGTATYTPTATATTAVQEAPFDNDSLQNPAQDVFFSVTGTRNFTYSDAVSYPNGDQEDWVQFEFPNNSNTNQNVWITLSCQLSGNVGNAQLRATIYEDGQQTTKIVICGQGQQMLTVDNTKVQQVKIHFGITNDGVYATYDLQVVGFQ